MATIRPTIAKNSNYLKLRWTHAGKRYSLADDFKDGVRGRKRAEAVAVQIENDILANNFDETLERYRVTKRVSKDERPSYIQDVWTAYLEQRQKVVKASTYHKQFKPIDKYFQKIARVKIVNADKFISLIQTSKPPSTAKRYFGQLSAAFKWGMSMGLCDENPFEGTAAAIKVNRKGKGKKDIDPFTIEERNRITRYFYDEQPQYAPFIEFLFLTGCRPSEAIALEWDKVFDHCIVFDQVAVQGVPGMLIQEGTKTEPFRRFPVNEQLKELLLWVDSKSSDPTGLVFKSSREKLIDLTNFTKRYWRKALVDLGIKHRKLYQTRHTFITLCLDKGIDAKNVAKWVGNSPEMIYRHYAGRNPNINVPEL